MELIERLSEFMASSSKLLAIDANGSVISPAPVVPGSPATLYVRQPTDALKIVSSGSVDESVDKETVWEVVGYAISREVCAALLSMEAPHTDLLDDVPALGYAWDVTEMGGGPAEPSM